MRHGNEGGIRPVAARACTINIRESRVTIAPTTSELYRSERRVSSDHPERAHILRSNKRHSNCIPDQCELPRSLSAKIKWYDDPRDIDDKARVCTKATWSNRTCSGVELAGAIKAVMTGVSVGIGSMMAGLARFSIL
jgi:hypothetical protein